MFCQILLNDLITKLKYAIVSLVNIMKLCINDKKIELKEANTFFKELRGLMFKKHINYALKFRCNGIHTFFMKSNIDVILTDKHNNVLYTYKDLKRRKIILPKKDVYYIYELPPNTINEDIKKIRIVD